MGDTAVYGEWDVNPARWAHRSYLYSLPPIGIGTAAVESFTGYITRLAAAHAVEAGVLVNQELLPRVPYTKGSSAGHIPSKLPTCFFLSAFPLNGIGERTRLWVPVLEQLTCVDRLDLLTCLPWAKVISCVHLLRTQRAWCPFCYGAPPSTASSVDQPVYERLLWTFQVVTVCPIHRCPLESICSSCGQTQYVFSPRLQPGYCSRCQCWLGRAIESFDGDLPEQVRIAEMVGELLAASPRLPTGFGLEQFQENTRNFRRNRQFHSTIRRDKVRGWTNAGNAPRMDSLLLLSLRQNVSMLRLLTEKIFVTTAATATQHSTHAHFRVFDSDVESALRAALWDDVPQSLAEIAMTLGYRSVTPLQGRFRDLCDEIVRKRRANLKRSPTPPSIPLPRERIERALSEALNQGALVSLHSLAAKIGLRNKRRLYKGFHDLRNALIANNKRLRQQRMDAIESALRTALTETPVPTVTEFARRLGLKGVTWIARRFPDLFAQLKQRSRAA
jgi:hypothetical protein